MKGIHLIAILFTFFILSCEKEEIPIEPRPDSAYITSVQDIGSDYDQQIFFDLNTNSEVLVQSRYLYDLKWNCADTNDYLLLNTSIAMGAVFLPNEDFDATVSLSQLTFFPDSPSGNEDSLVLGEWWNQNGIYIIHRGYSSSGVNRGYYKLKLKKVGSHCRIITADIDGTNIDSTDLTKDATYNFVGFDYNAHNQVIIEPASNTWDLLFTQYTFIYPDSTTYLVTGALQNPKRTYAAILETDFDETSLQEALMHTLSEKEDILGFNWKWYNYDDQLYEVSPNQFIIKSQSGTYFKFRFTDFYNLQGEKGAFNFEFEAL